MTSPAAWFGPTTLNTSPTFRRSAGTLGAHHRGETSSEGFAPIRQAIYSPHPDIMVPRFVQFGTTPSVFYTQKIYMWHKLCFFPRSPHGIPNIRATRYRENEQIASITKATCLTDLYIFPPLWWSCATLLSSPSETSTCRMWKPRDNWIASNFDWLLELQASGHSLAPNPTSPLARGNEALLDLGRFLARGHSQRLEHSTPVSDIIWSNPSDKSIKNNLGPAKSETVSLVTWRRRLWPCVLL